MNLPLSDNGLESINLKVAIPPPPPSVKGGWGDLNLAPNIEKRLVIFMAAIPIPMKSMSEKQRFKSSRQMGLKSSFLPSDAVAFPCSATEILEGQGKWAFTMSLLSLRRFAQVLTSSSPHPVAA